MKFKDWRHPMALSMSATSRSLTTLLRHDANAKGMKGLECRMDIAGWVLVDEMRSHSQKHKFYEKTFWVTSSRGQKFHVPMTYLLASLMQESKVRLEVMVKFHKVKGGGRKSKDGGLKPGNRVPLQLLHDHYISVFAMRALNGHTNCPWGRAELFGAPVDSDLMVKQVICHATSWTAASAIVSEGLKPGTLTGEGDRHITQLTVLEPNDPRNNAPGRPDSDVFFVLNPTRLDWKKMRLCANGVLIYQENETILPTCIYAGVDMSKANYRVVAHVTAGIRTITGAFGRRTGLTPGVQQSKERLKERNLLTLGCLLYTSDAADE